MSIRNWIVPCVFSIVMSGCTGVKTVSINSISESTRALRELLSGPDGRFEIKKDGVVLYSLTKVGDKVNIEMFESRPLVATEAISAFSRRLDQADYQACQANLKDLGIAIETFSADNGGHYPTNLGALVPAYRKVIPVCPAAGKDTYSESYHSQFSPDEFSYSCGGEHHAALGVSANFPQYNNTFGLIAPRAKDSP